MNTIFGTGIEIIITNLLNLNGGINKMKATNESAISRYDFIFFSVIISLSLLIVAGFLIV
jgi:hypothetical protein